MNRYVPVNGREEQAAYRGRERGGDPTQFEEKHVGAVFAVEHVEVNKAVDENDAP